MYSCCCSLLFRFCPAHSSQGYFPVAPYQLRSIFVYSCFCSFDRVAIFCLCRFPMASPLPALSLSLCRCPPFRTTMGPTSIRSSSPRSHSIQAPIRSTSPTSASLLPLICRTIAPTTPSRSPKASTPKSSRPIPFRSVLRFPFFSRRVHQPLPHQREPVDSRRRLVASALLHVFPGLPQRRPGRRLFDRAVDAVS